MNVNNPRNINGYYKHTKPEIWSRPYLIIIDTNYKGNPKMDRYFVDYNGKYDKNTRFKDLPIDITTDEGVLGLYIDDNIKDKKIVLDNEYK